VNLKVGFTFTYPVYLDQARLHEFTSSSAKALICHLKPMVHNPQEAEVGNNGKFLFG
jgi:hypothetical protein